MGVYPMLADETCWFLAVDFDKSTWMEDVRAFVADVPPTRSAGCGRAIAIRQWCARLVLLLRAGRGEDGAQDGLLPHDRDDGRASRAVAWTRTTACFRARTRCRAVASAI